MNEQHGPATTATRIPIPRTIWALGFVSLFTDMSSEMVHGLLPILLAGGLGASALVIGLIEGAAEALVLVVKVFSGYISDAMGRRKPLVLLGYGLATAVKPLFPLADSVATVTTARLLDRFGKGIRGAPRDALVGDLAPPAVRGAAFGLRQSMDTIGAVIGPLLAIGLMWLLADDIRAVLWWAVVPGIVAVLLLLRLPEPEHEIKPARLPLTRAGLARLGPAFVRLTVLGAFFSLARFSEAFLVLRAADVGVPMTYVPLVLVVMSAIYALTAYPAGHLSDRMPRSALLAGGMVMLGAGPGAQSHRAVRRRRPVGTAHGSHPGHRGQHDCGCRPGRAPRHRVRRVQPGLGGGPVAGQRLGRVAVGPARPGLGVLDWRRTLRVDAATDPRPEHRVRQGAHPMRLAGTGTASCTMHA